MENFINGLLILAQWIILFVVMASFVAAGIYVCTWLVYKVFNI